jgi:acetylornithine deacetylase
MKGGIAAMIKAVEAITKCNIKLKGDVIIQCVIGEETGEYEYGTTSAIRKGYTADAAIFTEPVHPPDPLAIQPTHGGLIWMRITVKGKAAHIGVRYELIRTGGKGEVIGVSAIDKASKIYNALMELENQWGQTKKHPLFPPGFFCLLPGIIKGGTMGVDTPLRSAGSLLNRLRILLSSGG